MSITGWGAACEGRIAKGKWPISLQNAHINFLELLTVSSIETFHAVPTESPHFGQIGQHNGGGIYKSPRGTHSPQLHSLARRLIVWGLKHFHSLRATHVPGIMNVGAELLSRGGSSVWRIDTPPSGSEPVVEEVWPNCRRSIHLARKYPLHPILFSGRDGAPKGVIVLVHLWPNVLLYAFPLLSLIIPT